MPRPVACGIALIALSFAGCSGGGSGGEVVEEEDCDLEPALCDPLHYLANHHCIVNDVHPRVYAPDTPGPDSEANPWRQGDFWRYRLTIDGEAHESELVYFDDIDFNPLGQAEHYLVGVAGRQEALDHALFSVNPMLGRIHRTLYSPHESGVHADMFYFPLCEGAAWTTAFYGTQFNLAATRKTLLLPGGASDALGFEVRGMSPDGSTLRHTYSPEVKWFTQLELHRADGLDVELDLLAWGSGKTGRYEFLRAQKDEVVNLAAVGPQGHSFGREDGGEGPYHLLGLWLEAQRTSGSARVEVHLRDPSGNSRACVGIAGDGLTGATACPRGPLKAEVPYQAGTWSVTVDRQLLGDAGVSGQARIVSMYDRGGAV